MGIFPSKTESKKFTVPYNIPLSLFYKQTPTWNQFQKFHLPEVIFIVRLLSIAAYLKFYLFFFRYITAYVRVKCLNHNKYTTSVEEEVVYRIAS